MNLIGQQQSRIEQNRLSRALSAWIASDPGTADDVVMTRKVSEQLIEMGYVEGENQNESNGQQAVD